MASTSSQSDYGSSDYLNALNSYMAELQRVNNKFQEFDRQRFTFIKAIERDHLVNGTGHLYIQCIQALEDILAGLKMNEYANRVDVAVIGLFLDTIYSLYNVMHCILQLYHQLRPSFGFDASGSDAAVQDIQCYLSARSNLSLLATKRQVHLNDREAAQFGGVFNLVPYAMQTVPHIVRPIQTHINHMQREEMEAALRAQQKPPSPPPQTAMAPSVVDVDLQTRAEDIFRQGRQTRDSETQLTASDWRRQQLQEKHRNYVHGRGHFPPFAVDN